MVQVPEWAVVIFIVATLIGIILQAAVLLGLLMAARSAMKRVDEVTTMTREHAVPLMGAARRIAEENSSNVKTIVSNIKETTDTVSQAAKKHVEPTLATVQRIVEVNSANVETIVANVAETSHTFVEVGRRVRDESSRLTEKVDALIEKTEQQADRVDEMVTGTLNSISHATSTLQRAVTVPVRQVGAVFSGLRAGLGALFTHDHNHNNHDVSAEEEGGRFV